MLATTVPNTIIGPSIMGLITSGMYDRPLVIYREYIQNAVDSLSSFPTDQPGQISITADTQTRQVHIRDNGRGLSYEECIDQLIPIAHSKKRIGADRGFRGIGRLSGLAFTGAVTFRTRKDPAKPVTQVTWERFDLQSLPTSKLNAEHALQNCVTIRTDPGQHYPDHFFEVELSHVSLHAAGALLNEHAIRSYIREVCPVPMAPDFPFTREVKRLLGTALTDGLYKIVINGNADEMHRHHRDSFILNENRKDMFTDYQEFQIPTVDGNESAAVAWVAHSSYLGAIPKAAHIRGLRARVGNIQIGDESAFDHLFPEDRFNRWCVGEVHILDPRIVPNARRDYFEPSPHLRNLENQLGPICRALSSKCRESSSNRNKEKRILETLQKFEEMHALATTGFFSPADATQLVATALDQEEKLREGITNTPSLAKHAERADSIKNSLSHFVPPAPARIYAEMHSREVETYQRLFSTLVEVAPSVQSAKEIILAVASKCAPSHQDSDSSAKATSATHAP